MAPLLKSQAMMEPVDEFWGIWTKKIKFVPRVLDPQNLLDLQGILDHPQQMETLACGRLGVK